MRSKVLVVGEVPVHLAEINIVVQGVRVRCKVLSQARERLSPCGIGGQSAGNDNVGRCIALTIVIKEEEKLVFENGAANIAAKLVEVISALGTSCRVVIPGVCIERFITIELEYVTV